MKKITNELKRIERLEKKIGDKFEKVAQRPRNVLEKFPTVLMLLVTAGLVLILYGLEKVFDKIAFLENNPLFMILVGIGILAFTGRLYKKLDN